MTAIPPHHPVIKSAPRQRAKNLQFRLADHITPFVGSRPFVYHHVLLFGDWMVVFERSPWSTLTLAVSLEAIFLSCFVMIGQNHQVAFPLANADQGEQELKLNTELTRAIHVLTREVDENVVGNTSTTPGGRPPVDQPRTTIGQCSEGT